VDATAIDWQEYQGQQLPTDVYDVRLQSGREVRAAFLKYQWQALASPRAYTLEEVTHYRIIKESLCGKFIPDGQRILAQGQLAH
jgi:hypothetical protein